MNTVVLVLMLLTAFNFLLKQTFWKVIAVCVIAAICAAFAGLMWPYAIEQSKTQIANWLSNQPLMLDTAVLLSVRSACKWLTPCWLSTWRTIIRSNLV